MKYIIILLFLIPTICNAQSLRCIDGDTFTVGKTYYRLSYIDTPEKNELGYKEASKYTCNYLKNNKYKIIKQGKDKYGRTLVIVGSLNKELISNCLAEPFYGKTTKDILILHKKCK